MASNDVMRADNKRQEDSRVSPKSNATEGLTSHEGVELVHKADRWHST